MGISTARLGDRCEGRCHHPSHSSPLTIGGTIITASPNVSVNGLGAARLGDQVETDCGHIGNIITGDPTVAINNLPSARIGDKVGGVYRATIVSGSGNVTS